MQKNSSSHKGSPSALADKAKKLVGNCWYDAGKGCLKHPDHTPFPMLFPPFLSHGHRSSSRQISPFHNETSVVPDPFRINKKISKNAKKKTQTDQTFLKSAMLLAQKGGMGLSFLLHYIHGKCIFFLGKHL